MNEEIKISNNEKYRLENGEWWHYPKSGKRYRCKVRECLFCLSSYVSTSQKGYCSLSCGILAYKKTVWETQSNSQPQDIYCPSDKYYFKDQRWWYFNGRQRRLCVVKKCEDCERLFPAMRHNAKYCDLKCKKKGRKNRITKYGYIYVFVPNHLYANSDGCVFEHRLVMESHLNRYILPEETIHHKNGKRNDNRIENLELWTGNHGTGTRVSDMYEWCEKFIEQYKNEIPLIRSSSNGTTD